MLIPVILSGGSGTRLWPVSRSAYPKPFMHMADGQSLLYKTFDRAWRLADGGRVLTVTGRDYYFLSRDEYAHHPDADLDRLPFLLEPVGRNTAPAVCLAALYTMEHIGAEATLLVLPADHLIADVPAFDDDVRKAQSLAEDGRLVTFGISPTTPETGFGYIRMGDALPNGRDIAAFVEKPDRETAERYVAEGIYLWNAGMFVMEVATLISELDQHAPDLAAAMREFAGASAAKVERIYRRLDFDAFDRVVAEKSRNVLSVRARFRWHDVGSWEGLWEALGGCESNVLKGEVIALDCEGVLARGADKRLMVLLGVKDLVAVDTGDALLIASRKNSQDLRRVVDELARRRLDRYL